MSNKVSESNQCSNKIRHIFINVVERKHNPFYKIKSDLLSSETDCVSSLKLSNETLNKILDVEYSGRRNFRFLYYRSVFIEIRQNLQSHLSKLDSRCVFIYLTDEGVWSEMVKTILKDFHGVCIRTVMVQHGLHFIEDTPSNFKFREFINKLTTLFFGYPSYGYGYVGSNLDYYLVYSESDRTYIEAKDNQSLAFSCPKLIKYDFIQEYITESGLAAVDVEKSSAKVLFAMEPLIPTSGVNCTEVKMYEKMASLFREVSLVTKSKIVFRPHPGMDTDKAKSIVSKLSYSDIIVFDSEASLNKIMSKVDFVLSVHSTVLFDALLVGKVPVQVITSCDDRELHTRLELLNADNYDRKDVEKVFSKSTIASYFNDFHDSDSDDDIDWSSYVRNLKESI